MTDHIVDINKKVLSPAAQVVLSAFTEDNALHNWSQNYYKTTALAAAIRAVADQLDHATSAHTLYAIADELEGR